MVINHNGFTSLDCNEECWFSIFEYILNTHSFYSFDSMPFLIGDVPNGCNDCIKDCIEKSADVSLSDLTVKKKVLCDILDE